MSGAATYMPLQEKDEWARNAAAMCINRVTLAAKDGDDTNAIPDYYTLNQERKSRVLYALLANTYLGFGLDLTEGYLVSTDDYDRWAGSHVMNQIERLKRTAQSYSLRDRIYDMLYDYKDAERRLNTEIASILSVHNDACSRLLAMLAVQTTPEYLTRQKDELDKLMKQMDEYAAQRGEAVE